MWRSSLPSDRLATSEVPRLRRKRRSSRGRGERQRRGRRRGPDAVSREAAAQWRRGLRITVRVEAWSWALSIIACAHRFLRASGERGGTAWAGEGEAAQLLSLILTVETGLCLPGAAMRRVHSHAPLSVFCKREKLFSAGLSNTEHLCVSLHLHRVPGQPDLREAGSLSQAELSP